MNTTPETLPDPITIEGQTFFCYLGTYLIHNKIGNVKTVQTYINGYEGPFKLECITYGPIQIGSWVIFDKTKKHLIPWTESEIINSNTKVKIKSILEKPLNPQVKDEIINYSKANGLKSYSKSLNYYHNKGKVKEEKKKKLVKKISNTIKMVIMAIILVVIKRSCF